MENDIENDQELYSYFVQRNSTLCEDNFSYLMEHKEVKLLLNDYLSNILLHKPDDVFKFTRDYFRIFSDEPRLDKLLIVVGPEGTGKSSLNKKLVQEFPDKFQFPLHHTTRKLLENEREKYFHLPKAEFLNMIDNDQFIIQKFEDDEYEGLSRKEVDRVFAEGKTSISDANNIYHLGVEATFIAVIPPSLEALRNRLKENKIGNTSIINSTLQTSIKEIKLIQTTSYFSHLIVNDDLETGYQDFKNSIMSSFPFLKQNYDEILFANKSILEPIQ